MSRWVAQLKQEHGGITPTSKAMTPEQKRIQELEAKIKQIEWENDILKKASALLMQASNDRFYCSIIKRTSFNKATM